MLRRWRNRELGRPTTPDSAGSRSPERRFEFDLEVDDEPPPSGPQPQPSTPSHESFVDKLSSWKHRERSASGALGVGGRGARALFPDSVSFAVGEPLPLSAACWCTGVHACMCMCV